MESSAARRWVAWSLRRGPALAVAALVVTVPAAWLTARLYRNLSSDVEELLPRQAPSVLATDELRARVPGLSTLGVVVDAGRPDRVPAAEHLLDDLAARVRTYPPELVRSVRVGGADEARFFDRFGPLYIEPADMAEIQHRVQSRKSWEARRKLDILFDDEPAPPLDFSDLQQKYRRQLPGTAGTEARFSNTDAAISVLLIEGTEKTARLAGARQLVSRVEADLRQLGGPRHYAPGMRAGLAGNVAVSVEELQALSEDLGISTVIVVSTVLTVILLFFGWWIAIPALLIPLAIGTVAAFGLAAVLPLGIDRLNSSTAFLGSIVVGNGVNFGIVWLARYAEARRRALPVEAALAQALAGALPGTLIAALAAATSYGSLAVTQFRGFRQFGFIGGIGMLTAWVSTFLLTPPLVAWLERVGRRRVPRRSPSPPGTSARTPHPPHPAVPASSSREGLGTLRGFPSW
jgi:predicted RND superfamily exporter protein